MPKILLTKKLYQYCFVISLIFVLNQKVFSLSQVSGTTCFYAEPNEVLTINEKFKFEDTAGNLRTSGSDYVKYEIPSTYRNDIKNKLLCLKVPKIERCSSGSTCTSGYTRSSGIYYYYPFEDRDKISSANSEWLFENEFGYNKPDTYYTSLDSCMTSGVTYKYYSAVSNEFYNTEDECVLSERCSSDTDNFCRLRGCPGNSVEGKYHFYLDLDNPRIQEFRSYDTKNQCEANLKSNACSYATSQFANCMPDSVFGTGFPGSLYEKQAFCNGFIFNINATNVDNLNTKDGFINLFSNLLGSGDYENNWNSSKSSLYGNWTCNSGRLTPPSSVPEPTRCDFPDYSMFSGGLGRSTCTGSNICESENVIRPGSGTNSDKNFFCINDQIIMCPNSISNYADAKDRNSGCSGFNPLGYIAPIGSALCTIDTNGDYFKYLPPYTPIPRIDIDAYIACVERTGNNRMCHVSKIGVTPEKVYKCTCVEQPGVLCTIGGVAGLPCEPICNFQRSSFNIQQLQPVKIQSPLALINVVANFLFWAAVIIFIINIMSAGFDYVRNADEPDKLKEATSRITGTIFGFVFLLIVAGVINYIITTLGTIIQ